MTLISTRSKVGSKLGFSWPLGVNLGLNLVEFGQN